MSILDDYLNKMPAASMWRYSLGNLWGNQGGQSTEDILRGATQQAAGYISPYTQFGIPNLQRAQDLYGGYTDPAHLEQTLMAGYTESPEAKATQQEGEQSAMRGAAASGMQGSGALMKALQQQGQQITQQDYGNQLQRRLGMYGAGTQGLMGLGQLGGQAASGLAGLYAGMGTNLAGLAQAQAAARNQQMGGMMSGIGSMIGTLAPYLIGGL